MLPNLLIQTTENGFSVGGSLVVASAMLGLAWALGKIKRHKRAEDGEGWRYFLRGVLIALIILVSLAGLLFLPALILGVGSASLGWLALALLCGLSSGIVAMILAAGIFQLIANTKIHPFGWALIALLFLIPVGIAAGAGANILFLSIFLGIGVTFETGMFVWLCSVAILLLGSFGVFSLSM